jgi:voltage-gated potassium channel
VTRAVTEPTERWHVGSRASRLRASHSYGVVLWLIVGLFLCAAALPNEAWVASGLLLLQSATLVTALWTSGLARADSVVSIALAAVAAAVAVVQLASGGERLAGAVALFTGVLTAATIVVVALGVVDQREANAQSVRGAICVYLLLGLLFVFVYGASAQLGEGAFFAQGTDGTRSLWVYFSFVTLATLGYGDYTPAGDLGHTLAVVEALVGQLYLVTVVALLVSRLRPARRAG